MMEQQEQKLIFLNSKKELFEKGKQETTEY